MDEEPDLLPTLSAKVLELEAHQERLQVLPEVVQLLHGCLADLFDIVDHLGAELDEDVDNRLDRLLELGRLLPQQQRPGR